MLKRFLIHHKNLSSMSKKCKADIVKKCLNSKDCEIVNSQNMVSSKRGMELEITNKINNITRFTIPIKSESDKKNYSVIKLENGLTALLCSDLNNLEESSSVNEVDDSNTQSSDNETSESDSDKSMSSNTSGEKGRKKKAGKKEEKLGACSLTIGVGSFSDPPEIPGLAHFLEHMVFMGSTKYPQENEFDSFIKLKGGSDNASTDSELTTFYFECPEKHLPKAMDIFSQFFVSPLMKRNAMTREREAIESEFNMSLSNDVYRKQQLICSTASNDNPGRKFSWGNLITLRNNVSDDFLYESVHNFRERHYSAHRMTLAVQGRLPLKTLEQWVVQYFSGIPSNNLPPMEHKLLSSPFNEDLFHKLYYIESVSDLMQIDLNWILPETITRYRSKPTHYLSWIIGHEGKGSLISHLRKQLWATDLVAGQSDDGSVNNRLFTIFSITIYLTENGYENIQNVLDAVFSYIMEIKNHGPDQRIFNEIKQIAEVDFKFNEEQSAVDNVEALSESMQIYPPELYIAGGELYFEFKPEEIVSFLNLINPRSVNIMISKKNHGPDINLDKTEEWFKTRYAYKNISPDWILNWESITPYKEFAIPEPNPYITSDFHILTGNIEAPKYPVKINKSDFIEIWHKPDTKFKHPVGFLGFHILTSITEDSVVNSTMLYLYTLLLNHFLIEELYPANMALLNHTICPSEKGMLIEVYGFSEKLHLLLEKISEYILKFNEKVNDDILQTFKKMCQRLYYNKNLKRGNLCRNIRMSILLNKYYTSLEKYNVISSINIDLLKDFSSNIFKKVYIQCLVQGNILEQRAMDICNHFITELKTTGIKYEERPKFLVNQLQNEEKCCQVKSFNLNDSNSYVTNYYQFGPATIRDYCTCDLLTMIMEEPLFDQLRTQQQLGYSVSCEIRETYGILGFSITVVCPLEKHSADYVEGRITEFLINFRSSLNNYPETDFKEAVQSLIRLKQCCDVHIKDEIKRNWVEIKSCEYGFDKLERQVTVLETIKADDITAFLEGRINNKLPSFKKLSIEVIGHISSNNSDNEIEEESYELPKQLVYQLLTDAQRPKDYFITNIEEFRKTLHTYPENKIF